MKHFLFAVILACLLTSTVYAEEVPGPLGGVIFGTGPSDGSGNQPVCMFDKPNGHCVTLRSRNGITHALTLALPAIQYPTQAFVNMTAAQIADVVSGASSLDVSGPLNTLLNASVDVIFPCGIYGIKSELLVSHPVHIMLPACATIIQTAGWNPSSAARSQSVIHFSPAASGSTLEGAGVIDGNRAGNIAAYLAMPRQVQTNGLYVIQQEWNCVTDDGASDISITGVTVQNCMEFAVAHEAGNRFRATNIKVINSSVAVLSQSGTDASWHNISELNIGNQVNGVAIPIFAYANTWVDLVNPVVDGVTLNGYAPLHYDGTSASPGTRIGDPYGGAFMVQRVSKGALSHLHADGFAHSDGRSVAAAWGLACDNCSDTTIDGIGLLGFYWSLEFDSPLRVVASDAILDGKYNTAAVSGASGATGIWLKPSGQLKGNTGLSSAFDHDNMMPPMALSLTNVEQMRSASGFAQYAGNIQATNIRLNGNTGPGWLIWAQGINPGYPAAGAFPTDNTRCSNIETSYNGGDGFQFNDGVNVRCSNVVANDNGQESAVTFRNAGIEAVSGFGGVKKNIAFSTWVASDDQSVTIPTILSVLPGTSGAGNSYGIVAANSAQFHIGQHLICKACGTGSADVNFKVTDIANDVLTAALSSPTSFDGSACSIALAGTVSVPAGANILTGVGTAFRSVLNGPSYLKAAGQYLKIGQVLSDTSLQMDTAAVAAISGAAATIVQCAAQGVPSQGTGFSAVADANISNVSIGEPSSYQAVGNISAQLNVAPASLRDDSVPYTPTFSSTGGSGVGVTGGATYRISGKWVCLRGYAQVTYSTAPNSLVVGLPPNVTTLGGAALLGFNASTNAQLFGISNSSTAVGFAAITGVMLSASGQYLQYNGCLQAL